MADRPDFPLPFDFTPAVDESAKAGGSGFLVAAMYTRSYADRAARLRASCERLNLPFVLYEIPAVHYSISVKGNPDLRFTKANFIRFLLARYRRPILYVDADCVFCGYPKLIDLLVDGGTAFAIYNWAADRQNDGFTPIDMSWAGQVIKGRYYGWLIRVNCYTEAQLKCSGGVQLYADTPAAHALLESWQQAIERFPGSADDNCLNFAFNNGGSRIHGLNPAWLPKAYLRCAWWIYIKPIVDHPDQRAAGAATQFVPIPETDQEKEFYPERTEIVAPRFSESTIIDVKARLLYRADEGKLAVIGHTFHDRFWIGS